LTARDANAKYFSGYLALEFVDQRGFTDAWLPRDEDDLPLVLQSSPKAIVQLAQRPTSSDQSDLRGSRRKSWIRRATFAHSSDEPVAAPVQCLNKERLLRTIPQRGSDLQNVLFHGLRLDMSIGPHRLNKLILCHEPLRVLHQISQDCERLGPQQNALVVSRIPAAPKTLVDSVKAERGKRLHDCPVRQSPGIPKRNGNHFWTEVAPQNNDCKLESP